MNALFAINHVLLTLLGISTGLVKLFGMPEELEIYQNAGFSPAATFGFGVAQLALALALLHPKSARVGAIGLALSFVVATGILFVNEMTTFGVSSLLFIAMAGLVIARPQINVATVLRGRGRAEAPN